MAEKQPTEAQARKREEQARAELEQAQQLVATVARGGMAHLTVEVQPGNTVNHNGENYEPGEQFHVEGLTAVGLAQSGHVLIVGTHDGDLDEPEQVRKQTIEAEAKRLDERAKELRTQLKGGKG